MPTDVEDIRPTSSQLRCRARGLMAEWLSTSGGSLAISTYTSGKLVFVSSVKQRLIFRTHQFARPMGIAVHDNLLAMAVRNQILLFRSKSSAENRFYAERSYKTGKVDAHDVAFGEHGIYFANTRFNCIAKASSRKNFIHCWQPPFIENVSYGDRCHLNGIGMQFGKPRMATAFSVTNQQKGWRELDRFTGGVVLDLHSNEVIVEGLCMPHSPRWHNGRWWLCNSGQGLLSTFDPQTGQTEEVCSLPGFTRGLCFVGNYALVGLSKIRRKHILDAPPVRDRHRQITAGVALIELSSGNHVGSLDFLKGGNEVFDVVFLPNIQKPTVLKN